MNPFSSTDRAEVTSNGQYSLVPRSSGNSGALEINYRFKKVSDEITTY